MAKADFGPQKSPASLPRILAASKAAHREIDEWSSKMTDEKSHNNLTQEEASRLIKRSVKDIRAWISSGQLPAVREKGKRTYVLRSTLLRFVESLETTETGN